MDLRVTSVLLLVACAGTELYPEADELEELAPIDEILDPEVPELETADATPRVALAPCSDVKRAAVLAPATSTSATVSLDCDLTLAPTDVVTRRIILEGAAASGVDIDCNGARIDGADGTVNAGKDMIEIRSRKLSATTWERPEDIAVRDCRIVGSIRIWGMGKNGEAVDVRDSSRQAGHTTRARNAAPRRILLDNLEIVGTGRTPLYLSPGVTYVTLSNSEVTGEATSVGVYLDTESASNTIRNNYLHVTSRQEIVGGLLTKKREEIAVDASSYNRIFNNRLSTLEGGGIYLYRNCGEGGTVRHSTPSHNQIINNVFYYNQYEGDNPSVYLGSRDNTLLEGRFYCGDDDGYPWGSSADDRSFARYNAVYQNQIIKRSLSEMIIQGDSSNQPNEVALNQTVTTEAVRPAGCYVASGYKTFVRHGETIDVFRDATGTPGCTGWSYTCNDGELVRAPTSTCSVGRVVTGCQVSGTNAGCQKVAACPAGRRLVGASAACNLEYGSVSDAELAAVPAGQVGVVRASDNVSDGWCSLDDDGTSSGRVAIDGIADRTSVSIACREKDSNGGDCHVRAALYCR